MSDEKWVDSVKLFQIPNYSPTPYEKVIESMEDNKMNDKIFPVAKNASELPQEVDERPAGGCDFTKELEHLLNRHSMELPSNTPDFILASYLKGCLTNFNMAMFDRKRWYGGKDESRELDSRSDSK